MTTELYINGHLVDLIGDIDISITYSVQDLEDPTQRKSTYSRTIEVPSSLKNDDIFGSIYLFNSWVVDFDPSVKAPCFIIQGGSQVFEGVAQLLAIKETERSRTYEIGLFGETANLFKTIDNLELTDIDFSDLNHVWEDTFVEDTWNDSQSSNGTGVYYPFIDYGQSFERQNTPPTSSIYETQDFYPGIYLLEYFNRIISNAGFTYVSNFLESTLVKQLVVPYGVSGVPYLPDEVIQSFQYYIRLLKVGTIDPFYNFYPHDSTTKLQLSVDTPSPYFDGGNYNQSLYRFVSPADISINVQFVTKCYPAAIFPPFYPMNAHFNLYKNGTFYGTFGSFSWAGSNFDIKTMSAVLTDVQLNTGDYLEVFVEVSDTNGSRGLFVQASETYWLNQINGTPLMQPGFTWDMNQTIVPKIKQSDLLSSMITMFNLYIYPDKYDPKKLYIEPWKDFFDQGVIDWTEKFDVNRGVDIYPSGFYTPKTFTFQYKSGGGFFEKRYQSSYNDTYGTRIYNANNQFNTGDIKKETSFGCAVMAGYTCSSRLAPRFFDMDQNGVIKPVAPGFRILYGRYTTYPQEGGTFIFEGNPKDKYPYAGTLDNPYNPTLDILFGIPRELYYSSNSENNTIYKYTDGNLFNTYWKNFIDTYCDKDAKKVMVYLQLNPVDIQNLDFRKLIYINGVLFYLLSIVDYNAMSDETTKVELLRVLNLDPFTPTQFELTNGTGSFIGDEPKPQTITQ
jgi:hypothetical protein